MLIVLEYLSILPHAKMSLSEWHARWIGYLSTPILMHIYFIICFCFFCSEAKCPRKQWENSGKTNCSFFPKLILDMNLKYFKKSIKKLLKINVSIFLPLKKIWRSIFEDKFPLCPVPDHHHLGIRNGFLNFGCRGFEIAFKDLIVKCGFLGSTRSTPRVWTNLGSDNYWVAGLYFVVNALAI